MVVDPRYNYLGRPFLVYAPIPPAARPPDRRAARRPGGPAPERRAARRPGRPAEAGPARRRGRPANPGVVAAPFLQTSPESWAETDPKARPIARDPAKDAAGPSPSASPSRSGRRPPRRSRRPGWSSSPARTSADNQIVRIEPTNLDLLMNAVHWLRGRPELLGIDPKTHESLMFAADPGLQLRLVMVPTLWPSS